MLLIIPILLFVILCVCLPQLMINTLIGSLGYFICKGLSKRSMANMIIIITIFSCLNVTMEKVLPLIEEAQGKQEYIGDKIDKYEQYKKYINPNSKLYDKEDIQKPIDKIIDENTPNNLFFRILTEYPRTR